MRLERHIAISFAVALALAFVGAFLLRTIEASAVWFYVFGIVVATGGIRQIVPAAMALRQQSAGVPAFVARVPSQERRTASRLGKGREWGLSNWSHLVDIALVVALIAIGVAWIVLPISHAALVGAATAVGAMIGLSVGRAGLREVRGGISVSGSVGGDVHSADRDDSHDDA
jgi:hypothetical protein